MYILKTNFPDKTWTSEWDLEWVVFVCDNGGGACCMKGEYECGEKKKSKSISSYISGLWAGSCMKSIASCTSV